MTDSWSLPTDSRCAGSAAASTTRCRATRARREAEAEADLIVRITADCPLIDPDEVGTVISELAPASDYAANMLERHLPLGLDTEAFWRDTLDRMARMATSLAAREHVTWFCYGEHPDLF